MGIVTRIGRLASALYWIARTRSWPVFDLDRPVGDIWRDIAWIAWEA